MLLFAEELEDGETRRILCPFCGGGSKKELSLSVTKDINRVLWNCHRASCGQNGTKGSRSGYLTTEKQRKQVKTSVYSGGLEYLSDAWLNYFDVELGITDTHMQRLRPMWATDAHRVAFPVFSPTGSRRGWVLRDYSGTQSVKALTRMDVAEPVTSWYRPLHSPSVIVVEDIPSAVRASAYIDAVALNGSGVSADGALELASYYSSVIWALDADATAASLKLHKKYNMLFTDSQVLILQKDIKNTGEEKLTEILTPLL